MYKHTELLYYRIGCAHVSIRTTQCRVLAVVAPVGCRELSAF